MKALYDCACIFHNEIIFGVRQNLLLRGHERNHGCSKIFSISISVSSYSRFSQMYSWRPIFIWFLCLLSLQNTIFRLSKKSVSKLLQKRLETVVFHSSTVEVNKDHLPQKQHVAEPFSSQYFLYQIFIIFSLEIHIRIRILFNNLIKKQQIMDDLLLEAKQRHEELE